MKKILHTIYTGLGAVVATALMLVGCIDDDLVKTNDVVEGVPITVNLTLSGAPVADVTVETKASGSDLSDVGDLVVFIFRNDGTFESVATNYNGSTSLKIVSSKVENGNRLYNVSFSTTSGTKKMLALANIADGGYWEGIIDQLTDGYNSKISFDDLKKMVVNLDSDLIAASKTSDGTPPFHVAGESQMLISGWNEGIVFDTSGQVTDNGTYGIEGSTVILQMRRAMAHINFEIAANPDGAKGTFTPTSYRVYNIPTKSYAINDLQGVQDLKLTSNIEVDGEKVEYIHTASEVIGVAQGGKYSFNFYMPENVQQSGSGATSYADREKWYDEGTSTSGASAASKDWNCAPHYSTFVVISGTYEGGSGEDGVTNVIANVEYTVHLGDFSEKSGSNFNDFTVKRNVSYTYKMSVLGVDNIIVEATTSDENQSGAEGSVYDQTNTEYSYNLDAHYEQVFLEYNLSNIVAELKIQNLTADKLDEAIANQLVLVIQSEAMDHNANGVVNKRGSLRPYKIYADAIAQGEEAAAEAKADILNGDMDGRDTPTKGFDYKWIEFWPQTGTTIAAYPGMSSWAMDDLTAEYGESQMANQQFYAGADGQTDNGYGDPKKLKDVYDIIVAMGKAVKSIYNNEMVTIDRMNEDGIIITNAGTTGEPKYVARFTAFVNEYYYLRHPLTGAKATSWSVMTNKIPREMIIAMSTQTSNDGNSSYSKIYSYISQLSMQTFYNDRVSSLNAFGIETYNETPLTFDYGSPSSTTALTDDNGRENQKILIGKSDYNTVYWNQYISATNNGWTKSVGTDHSNHKLNEAYEIQKAYSACMSRNRDLNGNGKIDEDEIRWYLASLNEYIRIGIGANALSSAARLYIGDKTKMVKGTGTDDINGYPSAYIDQGSLFYTSSGSGKEIYWAVEKGSYGGLNNYYNDTDSKLPIRCIRNLPAVGTGVTTDISSIDGVKSDATFEKHKASQDAPIILEFKDRLVTSLYRQRVVGALGIHNEDNAAINSFYNGIFVAEDFLSNQSLRDVIGYDGTMVNPCANHSEKGYTNWRVPNLVELSAMNAAGLLKNSSGNNVSTACCTQFTKLSVRYGFVFDQGIITCPGAKTNDINNTYSIRCVRDVPDGYEFPTN